MEFENQRGLGCILCQLCDLPYCSTINCSKCGKKFRFDLTHCGHISAFIYIVQFLFQQSGQKDGTGQNFLYKKNVANSSATWTHIRRWNVGQCTVRTSASCYRNMVLWSWAAEQPHGIQEVFTQDKRKERLNVSHPAEVWETLTVSAFFGRITRNLTWPRLFLHHTRTHTHTFRA